MKETDFDTIIDEIICNAWYSVREFHIHLSGIQADGAVRDGLERAVLRIAELSGLSANASKVEIKNDELWNLMPMDPSLNSSKSNRLPKWNPFFVRFARNQYLMYGLIHEKDGIRRLYESCYRDNLHSLWAASYLYGFRWILQ